MDPLTEAELKQFAPSARKEYIDALVSGWAEIEREGVNTPARVCEFLGQYAGHETGGMRIVREATNWTPAQMKRIWPHRFPLGAADPRIAACKGNPRKLANLAYSDRKDLGNRGGDDGWNYRGGSFCQLTGRAAYREAGEAIGLPLEERPDLIERPEVGLRVALWYWNKLGCSTLADRGYTRAIGNAINRGNPFSDKEPIGAADRQRWRDRAVTLFGDGQKIHEDGLALGAYGSQVEVLQKRLRELNYGTGAVDKVFGPATARAVAAFKLDHKRRTGEEMEPDEIVGSKTWHQLNAAEPIVYANREGATAKDVKAAGSSTITDAEGTQAAATGIAVVAAAKGAQESGAVEAVAESFSWMPALHSTMVPVLDALLWGVKHLAWVVTLVLAAVIWRKHGKVIAARVRDYVRGFNLNR